MLASFRSSKLCGCMLRANPGLLNAQVSFTSKRSFLTDGATVIGSNPDRNSVDFQVNSF